MNEQPQSDLKRSWKGLVPLLMWFILLVCATFVLFFAFGLLFRLGTIREVVLIAARAAIILTVAAVLAVRLVPWLCRWRNLRRFLFGVACVATLIALFYAEENLRGKAAWGKFKREWEAKGVRFEVAAIAPPSVPDELNFAMAPVVASSFSQTLDRDGHLIKPWNTNIINRMEMPRERQVYGNTNKAPPAGNWQKAERAKLGEWQAYYRKVAAVTNAFPIPAQPGTPAADVLLALSKYDPVIQELREAGRRPQSRYPLTYDADDPSGILLPHLGPLKGVAQTLQLRAIAELDSGQAEKALEDVSLALRLAEAVRTEPTLISKLVRISVVQIALQSVWEGLADHQWTDAQLVMLEQELGRLDFIPDYAAAIRGEVACVSGVIDYLRGHPEQLFTLISDRSDTDNAPSLLARLIPSGWFYQNQLCCARFQTQWYLPLADVEHRLFSPAAARRADAAVSEELLHRKAPYNFLAGALLPALGSGAVRRFAYAQSSVDLARVACALERYRLAHGEYPEQLDALTPQFLDKLPHDVINGQPLHYTRTADGRFVLYSVGWNESDDGGQAAKKEKSGSIDLTQGDWVWRYPSN